MTVSSSIIEFMALLELEARGSSLELESENALVTDGLSDPDEGRWSGTI